MALFLLKEMKGSKFSCASPASTAICKSIDHQSVARSSLYQAPKTRQLVSKIQQAGNNRQNLKRLKNRKRGGKADDDQIKPRSTSSQWLLSKYREDNMLSHWNLPELDNGDELVARVTSASNKSPSRYQVVVLRVSINCKGCEKQVRKHLSKMKGVAWFDIELAARKVTVSVSGDVTPLEVLHSVSKIKKAQFWQSPPRSSASI